MAPVNILISTLIAGPLFCCCSCYGVYCTSPQSVDSLHTQHHTQLTFIESKLESTVAVKMIVWQ